MTQHHYEQLLFERKRFNYVWEEVLTIDYTLEDLDHDEIRLAVEQGINANRVPTTIRKDKIYDILKKLGAYQSGWDIKKCCYCFICQRNISALCTVPYQNGSSKRN